MSSLEDRLKLLEPAPASDALKARLAGHARRTRWTRLVPMAAAAAGLVAVLIFALTEAPHGRTTATTQVEADLRKIEEVLSAAKTLRIEVQRHTLMRKTDLWKEELVKADLVILLKEGNRMQIDLREERGAGTPKATKAHFRWISDGKRLKMLVYVGEELKGSGPEKEAPADLRERFVLALAREAVGVPNTLLELSLENLKAMFAVSALRPWTDDAGSKRFHV